MHFDEFQVGDRFESREPRTLTSDDIEKFANLTGDMNLLHLNDEFSRTRKFSGRIAHGLLTLGIAVGQWYSLNLTRDSIVAFMGINNLSFRAPVYPGDRIRLVSEVIGKRESKSNSDVGLVTFRDKMVNQNEATVLEFERVLMLSKRKP